MLEKLFKNSIKIDSNVKNAKVTYIVDPYDRSQDIISYTPCKIKIPWEPQRIRANKAKVLVEKEGYHPKVVAFTKSIRFLIGLFVAVLILGILGAIINHNFGVPGYTLAIIAIVAAVNLSVGSGDLHVELEKL